VAMHLEGKVAIVTVQAEHRQRHRAATCAGGRPGSHDGARRRCTERGGARHPDERGYGPGDPW